MHYQFSIIIDQHYLRFTAERFYQSSTYEKYRVFLQGGRTSVVFGSNRPQVVLTNSKKEMAWKVLEGKLTHPYCQHLVFQKLMEKVKNEPVVIPPLARPATTMSLF
jgi:hypothetical protein